MGKLYVIVRSFVVLVPHQNWLVKSIFRFQIPLVSLLLGSIVLAIFDTVKLYQYHSENGPISGSAAVGSPC